MMVLNPGLSRKIPDGVQALVFDLQRPSQKAVRPPDTDLASALRPHKEIFREGLTTGKE
jgi:hypothetical protein